MGALLAVARPAAQPVAHPAAKKWTPASTLAQGASRASSCRVDRRRVEDIHITLHILSYLWTLHMFPAVVCLFSLYTSFQAMSR